MEEWVEQRAPEERLGEAWSQTYQSFLEWLADYKCLAPRDLAVINATVQSATGYALEQIYTLKDGDSLRQAIYAAGTSVILGRRRAPESLAKPYKWAIAHVEFSFGEEGEDPINEFP